MASLTWEDFYEIFERKFVPDYAKIKMREQYDTLTQGQMSMENYYQKFNDLPYYSPYKMEWDLVERFKKVIYPVI